MSNKEKYQSLIEKYLTGNLTEDESTEIINLKLTDSAFLELFEAEVALSEGARLGDLESKMDMLSDLEDDIAGDVDADLIGRAARLNVLAEKRSELVEVERRNTASPSRTKRLKLYPWLGAVAAIVIILIIAINAIQPKGPSEEYRHYFDDEFHTLIKHPTMRSSDWVDPLTREQRYAYQLFQAHLFEEAIPELEELWETQQDSLARYYLGWSYLGIGEDEKGEIILKEMK